MSGDRQQPSRQSYEDLVRSIIHDRPPEEVSPSGELRRFVERYYRNPDLNNDSDTNTTTTQAPRSTGDTSANAGPSRNLQRRFSREPSFSSHEPYSPISATPSPGLPPLRLYSSRPAPGDMASGNSGSNGLSPGFPWARSSRHRSGAPRSASYSDSGFALNPFQLSFTFPPPSPPLMSPPTHAGEDPIEDSRRAKRRKLDSSNPAAPPFKGFRYGRYGQVEPGQLEMEIVSCDGGIYREGWSAHAPENILKNDNSVYCTKSSKCNIVLRHQGATVFSLSELIILAPTSMRDYSSPVREGMVFVSMNNDELLNRTAQYQIQYGNPGTLGGGASERPHRMPAVMSVRHSDNDPQFIRIQGHSLHRLRDDLDDHHRVAQYPPEFTIAPPPFHVTTECSDEDDDAAAAGDGGNGGNGGNPSGGGGDRRSSTDSRHRSSRRTPNRIGALPFESESSDDWTSHVDDYAGVSIRRTVGGGGGGNGGGSGNGDQSLEDAIEASQLATQEAVRAVGGELLAPHARFNIEKDKSKCTIRFDPPVSGRFILLKMWSTHMDPTQNIDIRGVIARGFAGPRYFPALERR